MLRPGSQELKGNREMSTSKVPDTKRDQRAEIVASGTTRQSSGDVQPRPRKVIAVTRGLRC